MLRFEEYGKQYPDLVYDIFTFYINSNVKSIFAKDMI
jgi:hypothetical protein